MRWETKKRIYMVSMTARWTWWPDVSGDGYDLWSFTWLKWSFEWFSKEWLEFCEEHGGGMESTLEWIVEEVSEQQEEEATMPPCHDWLEFCEKYPSHRC